MKSYEERMRLLIDFMEMALDSLRVGALTDLQADILELVRGLEWYEPELTVLKMEELQEAVLRTVSMVRDARFWPDRRVFSMEPRRGVRVGFEMVPTEEYEPGARPQDRSWALVPSIRPEDRRKLPLIDAFTFELHVTFSQADLSRLRDCKESCKIDGEGKPASRCFYAEHGNQQYCSARCGNRAKNRRYRERKNLARENL